MMGNTQVTYHCLPVEELAVFPSLPSITAAYSLKESALDVQSTVANVVSIPVSAVPVVGGSLSALLIFLTATDFMDVRNGALTAQIDESILGNNFAWHNAKIRTINSCLKRLNQGGLSIAQSQSELTVALRGAEELFHMVTNPDQVMWRYPMVSMPTFIRVMNIYWATLLISSKLDPSLIDENNSTTQQMHDKISAFKEQFFQKRLRRIGGYHNGKFSYISDEPWPNAPGSPRVWYDPNRVIREWNPYGFPSEDKHMIPRNLDKLRTYNDANDFREKLKSQYNSYFHDAFPV